MNRFVAFACLLLLASCATPRLQVVTLSSPQLPLRENVFALENDTMRLAYDFFTPNGSVRFSILNKLNRPLYVDWSKSAFIQGRERIAYWADGLMLNPAIASPQQGNVRPDERISFIPPGTEIRHVRFLAKPGDHFRFKATLVPETETLPVLTQAGRETESPVQRYQFEESSSPLVFRNYLTFSTDERFVQEFYVDTQFYVTEVEELEGRALFGADYFPAMLNQPVGNFPNRFHAPNKFLLPVRQQ